MSSIPDTSATDSLGNIKSVGLIARSYGDSIVIRWAPADAGVWMVANSYGWNIYRSSNDERDTMFHVTPKGDTIPMMCVNGDTPIKPMTLDEFMKRFSNSNLYAGAAAQSLYGTMNYDVNKAEQGNEMDLVGVAAKQYQEQTQRQFMAYLAAECDPQVASALGLRWVDKNVKKNVVYEYTIECLVPHDIAEIYGSSLMVPCKKFKRGKSEEMPEVRVTQLDAHRVAVRWDKNRLAGYFLERSSDNGKHWEAVNNKMAPIWPMLPDEGTRKAFGDSVANWMNKEVVYFDSLELSKTYLYRVQAFDAFGERLKWVNSEKFKLVDLIPPTEPMLLLVKPEENKRCVIDWAQLYEDPDLTGFVITFSRTNEGPWKRVSELLNKSTRRYVDTLAYRRGRGLYRIYAFDTAGNFSYSGSLLNFIEDVFPPEPPKGVSGVSDDSTGIVFLRWDEAKDEDFLGYKVYFANQRDHEFIGCTDGYIYKNEFYDTVDISSLTHEIFYYVITVDQNHNYSQPSDTVRLLLPDLIAPGLCLLDGVIQSGDSVTLRWKRSVSDDVKNYYVYRKFRDAARWEVIATLSPKDVRKDGMIVLIDTPTPNDKPYTWCIEAIDSAGNSSGMGGQVVAQVLPNPEIKANINLTASASTSPQGVKLEWSCKIDFKKNYYGVIYRAEENGDFVDIGTFKRGDSSYFDASAPVGKQLKYYIQLQLGNGRFSTPSNTVNVKIK